VDARRYQVTGTVAGGELSSARVVLAHDAVAGLMPAMTMTFEVRDKAPALREGDRVIATLAVTDSRSWLENVKVTATGGAAPPAIPGGSAAAPGAVVPAFALVDQDGRSFTLQGFAGRVLVLTFIYTRCPLPDFCPLMVRNLETVRRRAEAEGIGGRLALLGVTLDPAFDTPALLRQYGAIVLKGASRPGSWTLATGTAAQIDEVARFFGVESRAENELITHTLATAVVGADGRVMRIFPSNSWTPEAVFEVVRHGVDLAMIP